MDDEDLVGRLLRRSLQDEILRTLYLILLHIFRYELDELFPEFLGLSGAHPLAAPELLEGYPIEVADNSCAVEGLEAETVYTYSVVAKNAAGEEAEASNIIEVTTLAGTPAIKGDINGDGSIDGNDVSALLEMVLAGGVSDAQKAVADINGDNSVDGNDVSALLEMVLAGE